MASKLIKAINLELKQIHTETSIFDTKLREISNTHDSSIRKLEEKIKSANTSAKIMVVQNELFRTGRDLKKQLTETFAEAEDYLQYKSHELQNSGLQFSKHIKLFSEGGNFHIDEAKIYLRDLKGLEKNILKTVKSVRKELNGKLTKILHSVENRQNHFAQRFEDLKTELQHNEYAVEQINKLQEALKQEVFYFKLSVARAVQCWEIVKSQALTNRKKLPEYFQNFQKFFNSICEKFVDIESRLTRNVTEIEIESKSSYEESTPRIKSTDHLKSIFSTNYPPETFLTKLYNLISETYSKIENQAERFYENHTFIHASGIVQPTFEDFMEEVARKFKVYIDQCDAVWESIIYEVINCLDDQKRFISLYVNMTINISNQIYINEYTTKNTKKLEEIELQVKNDSNAFQSVLKELKPLHGHPNNKRLLSALEEKMECVFVERANNICNLINPFQEELQEAKKTFEDHLHSTSEGFKNFLKNECSSKSFTLADELREILRIYNTNRNAKEEQCPKNTPIISPQSSACVETQTVKSEQSLCSLLVSTIKELYEVSDLDVTVHVKEPNLNELIEVYNKDYETLTIKLEDYKNDSFTRSKNWKETWKNEVEKVLKLYSLKYGEQS